MVGIIDPTAAAAGGEVWMRYCRWALMTPLLLLEESLKRYSRWALLAPLLLLLEGGLDEVDHLDHPL
jgi:bacteriorhodopsin